MPGTCDMQVRRQKPSQFLVSKSIERILRTRLIIFFIAITYNLEHNSINKNVVFNLVSVWFVKPLCKARFFFILCRHPRHLLENHHVVQMVRKVNCSFCLKQSYRFQTALSFLIKISFTASEIFLFCQSLKNVDKFWHLNNFPQACFLFFNLLILGFFMLNWLKVIEKRQENLGFAEQVNAQQQQSHLTHCEKKREYWLAVNSGIIQLGRETKQRSDELMTN